MMELIKSTSYDQGEIIQNILKLHVPDGKIDCDPTFSTGAFYNAAGIEAPKLRFDIRPQVEGVVQADARSLPISDGSISCMMLDPPFLATRGASLSQGDGNRINRRFSVYPNEKSLHQCYADMLKEAYRILKPNGILIFKCQDKVSSGKQYLRVNTVEIEEKQVIEIDVTTGTNRPYYLREKGLKPGGVYVRKGSSTQPMTEEGIREMILQNSGRSFELCRSMNQELTFHTLQTEMQRRSIEIGPSQMRTLKLIGEDGLYTNLALLLSDQCESTTKVALFQGTDKELFRDRKEFTGSILKQLEDVYQFIDLVNKTKATFSRLDRTDRRDYPEEAVREALLNSIVHRDYSFSGSNKSIPVA